MERETNPDDVGGIGPAAECIGIVADFESDRAKETAKGVLRDG
jgi:hypothetical protein